LWSWKHGSRETKSKKRRPRMHHLYEYITNLLVWVPFLHSWPKVVQKAPTPHMLWLSWPLVGGGGRFLLPVVVADDLDIREEGVEMDHGVVLLLLLHTLLERDEKVLVGGECS